MLRGQNEAVEMKVKIFLRDHKRKLAIEVSVCVVDVDALRGSPHTGVPLYWCACRD